MASDSELSDFLKNVEKKAFKRAYYHVRDEDAALDILQDSMIKLCTNYADKPMAELPLLFQRILSNTVLDWFHPWCVWEGALLLLARTMCKARMSSPQLMHRTDTAIASSTGPLLSCVFTGLRPACTRWLRSSSPTWRWTARRRARRLCPSSPQRLPPWAPCPSSTLLQSGGACTASAAAVQGLNGLIWGCMGAQPHAAALGLLVVNVIATLVLLPRPLRVKLPQIGRAHV